MMMYILELFHEILVELPSIDVGKGFVESIKDKMFVDSGVVLSNEGCVLNAGELLLLNMKKFELKKYD